MCSNKDVVELTLSFKVLDSSLLVCVVNLSQSKLKFNVVDFCLSQFGVQEVSIFQPFSYLVCEIRK